MSKEVVDRAVGGEKTLRMTRGLESAPLPFHLPARLVRVLGAIVAVLARLMLSGQVQLPVSCTIASQLVRDHPLR